MAVLKAGNGLEPDILAAELGLTPAELQREIATLRHMEKIRAVMDGGKKVICLWQ